MPVFDALLTFIGRSPTARRSSVHHECRRCGTTLSHDRSACPTCGSSEIATIPL
ncbi:hypothetical protein [Natrinema sp. 1APR25-10V2]|uniref:hypothetical protein n=1 Tax=Natrinema sp. 1APR25-10V2 TaxID=2951081 RepID=UPI002876CC3E|nr:hypothetical protein [Natrinema sp. 1APR25-10V2]MDS0475658.1 hypothetical protein [Natrinema sp. 1APR25-10V2]